MRLLFLVLAVLWPLRQWPATVWQNYPIGQVFLLNQNQQADQRLIPYRPLLRIKSGDTYHYQDIRSSIENLYKTGVFTNIESKIEIRTNKTIDVYFILQNKPAFALCASLHWIRSGNGSCRMPFIRCAEMICMKKVKWPKP